jgi:hypothetical protein
VGKINSVAAIDPPSYEAVIAAVRKAMHDPDPVERALAQAQLQRWDLPAGPRAILLSAHLP